MLKLKPSGTGSPSPSSNTHILALDHPARQPTTTTTTTTLTPFDEAVAQELCLEPRASSLTTTDCPSSRNSFLSERSSAKLLP
jgi:hypothetical protein